MNRRSIENFKVCILGGAIGDALGGLLLNLYPLIKSD